MTEHQSSEEGAEGLRLSEAEREALVRAAVAYYARSRKGKGADPDYLLRSDPASLPVSFARDIVEPLVPVVERIIADRLAAVQADRDEANVHAVECERIGVEAIETRIMAEAENARLRARLAEVEALADAYDTWDGDPTSEFSSSPRQRAQLRAALASPSSLAQREAEVGARVVWHVSAHGRSLDRVCDSLATGKSVCDDLMDQLGGEWTVVEDWANLNVSEAPPRWVRYVSRGTSDPVEQSVAAVYVDTSGTWFRENTPAYRADALAAEAGGES
jgi:hypothetical protein